MASMSPQARSYCARFLERISRPSFVFLLKNKSFDFIAHGNDLVRVDIVFDGKFTAWDDTFGLVADVEKDFVTVNLDDGSFDDVSVVEVLDGRIDGCQ